MEEILAKRDQDMRGLGGRVDELIAVKERLERRIECMNNDLEALTLQREEEEVQMEKILEEKMELIEDLQA